MIKLRNSRSGFTIIELMIATAIFSLALLVVASVISQVGKMYYKGIQTTKTQDTTRNLLDELARTVQFGTSEIVTGPSVQFGTGATKVSASSICMGNTRYTFALNAQVSSSVADGIYDGSKHQANHGLWRDTEAGGGCDPVDITKKVPNGGKELLGENMRLKTFRVTQAACGENPITLDGVWNICVGVIYGDDDLIEFAGGNPVTCKGSTTTGSQWCGVAELSTQVSRRITSESTN